VLEVAETNSALHLALIDGRVGLETSAGTIALEKAKTSNYSPVNLLTKTALINIPANLQWALYYPAVLNPDELNLSPDDQRAFGRSAR